jgi:sugar/nucleoside kinase (ribokinase family)
LQTCWAGRRATDFPPEHLDLLRSHGIDTDGVQIQEGRTFRWGGYYEYDLNQAHTVSTELNVFEHYQPELPAHYRSTPYVFLANVDPVVQLAALDQMEQPKLVACDTMNYWIAGKRDAVVEVLRRVQIALFNDAEVRQLCGMTSLLGAAREVLSWGPEAVIVKKGEHGALLCTKHFCFSAPGFPLEEIKDPTGAGDSFAGGLIGYLAYTNDICEENLRKAVVHGSVMASYNVEDFSLRRLVSLTPDDILARYREFKRLSHFEDI